MVIGVVKSVLCTNARVVVPAYHKPIYALDHGVVAEEIFLQTCHRICRTFQQLLARPRASTEAATNLSAMFLLFYGWLD